MINEYQEPIRGRLVNSILTSSAIRNIAGNLTSGHLNGKKTWLIKDFINIFAGTYIISYSYGKIM